MLFPSTRTAFHRWRFLPADKQRRLLVAPFCTMKECSSAVSEGRRGAYVLSTVYTRHHQCQTNDLTQSMCGGQHSVLWLSPWIGLSSNTRPTVTAHGAEQVEPIVLSLWNIRAGIYFYRPRQQNGTLNFLPVWSLLSCSVFRPPQKTKWGVGTRLTQSAEVGMLWTLLKHFPRKTTVNHRLSELRHEVTTNRPCSKYSNYCASGQWTMHGADAPMKSHTYLGG